MIQTNEYLNRFTRSRSVDSGKPTEANRRVKIERKTEVKEPTKSKIGEPLVAHNNNICKNCENPGVTLRCSVCKNTFYCDKICQKRDWKIHKQICTPPK